MNPAPPVTSAVAPAALEMSDVANGNSRADSIVTAEP
jgi:hypothetical protein